MPTCTGLRSAPPSAPTAPGGQQRRAGAADQHQQPTSHDGCTRVLLGSVGVRLDMATAKTWRLARCQSVAVEGMRWQA